MPLGDVESLNVPSLVIVIDGVVHITSTSASLLVSELPDKSDTLFRQDKAINRA
jgi:hypothetical protein